MKDKWRRGDEAMSNFTGTWFNNRKEEMDTSFQTSPSSQHYLPKHLQSQAKWLQQSAEWQATHY